MPPLDEDDKEEKKDEEGLLLSSLPFYFLKHKMNKIGII
jgi:hypothetical protein